VIGTSSAQPRAHMRSGIRQPNCLLRFCLSGSTGRTERQERRPVDGHGVRADEGHRRRSHSAAIYAVRWRVRLESDATLGPAAAEQRRALVAPGCLAAMAG